MGPTDVPRSRRTGRGAIRRGPTARRCRPGAVIVVAQLVVTAVTATSPRATPPGAVIGCRAPVGKRWLPQRNPRTWRSGSTPPVPSAAAPSRSSTPRRAVPVRHYLVDPPTVEDSARRWPVSAWSRRRSPAPELAAEPRGGATCARDETHRTPGWAPGRPPQPHPAPDHHHARRHRGAGPRRWRPLLRPVVAVAAANSTRRARAARSLQARAANIPRCCPPAGLTGLSRAVGRAPTSRDFLGVHNALRRAWAISRNGYRVAVTPWDVSPRPLLNAIDL